MSDHRLPVVAVLVCACCERPVKASEAAARAFPGGKVEIRWCFDCWDNNPEAVEQYRDVI